MTEKEEVTVAAVDDAAKEEEEETEPKKIDNDDSGSGQHSRRSHHGKGMDSSVFRFSNLNFTVGSGAKETKILSDVSHVVKWGRTYNILASRFCSSDFVDDNRRSSTEYLCVL